MSTLTIRLPGDTAERLKTLAKYRGLSVNKLMEELSVQAVASFDAENRFKSMAAGADMQRALAVPDRLDRTDSA
ncbi:MAG: toxin-antitoxin system HicB family antitoxin [Wenzhouxiangella sp.]|jgi:predicted transcriptional regulator|nr:toxin-antitoxin system HicB family antitoxin [Wenzhouxiangella sp.]